MSNSTHTAFRKAKTGAKTGAAGLAVNSLLAGFLLALSVPAGLSAQSVPAQPPASGDQDAARRIPVTATPTSPTSTSGENNEEDEVVELSPFTVTADSSRGYTATQSLSGTRLKTDLKDIGSSITEMTVDFLKDIGATSFLDAVTYAPGTNTFLNEINDRDGNRAVSGIYYSVRGMSTAGMARDFYRTGMPIDMFNTERLSFARGANSVLYGIADPTGIVNTSLAKPIFQRDRLVASGEWGSYGTWRLNLDANATGKLSLARHEIPAAVRFITFTEERPKYIKPDSQEQTRYYITAAVQPWKGATFRGSFENVDMEQTGSRMFAPYDGITLWRERGANYTDYGSTAANPAGTRRPAVNALTVVTNPDGTQYAMNLANMSLPIYPEVPAALDSRLSLTDYSLYPADKLNFLGLNNSGIKYDGHSSVITYEQLVGRNFSFEIGASKESIESFNTTPISSAYFLYVDISRQLPDGSANPYLGVPFIDYARGEQNDVAHHSDYRATATYSLDLRRKLGKLGRWLGRHRFVGLLERYTYERGLERPYEHNMTPPTGFTANLADNTNRLARRTYLGPGYFPYLLDSTTRITNVPVIATTNGAANGRMFREVGSTIHSKARIDSALVAVQSFLFDEHLVFTGGLRWDSQDLWNGRTWRHPETGEESSAAETPLPDSPDQTDSGRTGTIGLIYHINRWVSLSWNRSENFQPPGAGILTVFDTPIPTSKGRTEDIGIKFRLFGEKIVGNINYFEAFRLNENNQGLRGSNDTRINAIWDVVNPGMKTKIGWSDIRDYRTQGYEFQLTANPTPALRISANVTRLKTVKENQMPFTKQYLAKYRAQWETHAQEVTSLTNSAGVAYTVERVLADLDQFERNISATNGQTENNLNEWMINFVGNYTVQSGPLRNFGFGIAQQWRSAPLLGFPYTDRDPLTNIYLPDISHPIYGQDWWNTNIWFTYERRILKNKARLILRLAMNNLLDTRTYEMERFINSQGEEQVSRYRFLAPRNFMLTATFQY
jgi:outer membrane receptor protein involved in Fe transport